MTDPDKWGFVGHGFRPREVDAMNRGPTPQSGYPPASRPGVNPGQINFDDADVLRKVEALVSDYWWKTFNYGPYSNFSMIAYLRLLMPSQSSYEDLWLNRGRGVSKADEAVIKARLEEDASEACDALLRGPGRCTTFAIQVARHLEDGQDGGSIQGIPKLDFEYHDVGRHRLARCKNTGLVIDSSLGKGITTLAPGAYVGVDEEDPRKPELRWDNGVSSTRRLDREGNPAPPASTIRLLIGEASTDLCCRKALRDLYRNQRV